MSSLQTVPMKSKMNLGDIFSRASANSFTQAKGCWWRTDPSSWQCHLHTQMENLHRQNVAVRIYTGSWGFPTLLSITGVQKTAFCLPPGIHTMGLGENRRCGSRRAAGWISGWLPVPCPRPQLPTGFFCQYSHAAATLNTSIYLPFLSGCVVDLIAAWVIRRSLTCDRLHPASHKAHEKYCLNHCFLSRPKMKLCPSFLFKNCSSFVFVLFHR